MAPSVDTGGIHEEVDAPELHQHGLYQGDDRRRLGEIDGEGPRFGARPVCLLGDLCGTIPVAVDDRDPRSFAGERPDGGSTNPGRPAGHDRDVADKLPGGADLIAGARRFRGRHRT